MKISEAKKVLNKINYSIKETIRKKNVDEDVDVNPSWPFLILVVPHDRDGYVLKTYRTQKDAEKDLDALTKKYTRSTDPDFFVEKNSSRWTDLIKKRRLELGLK